MTVIYLSVDKLSTSKFEFEILCLLLVIGARSKRSPSSLYECHARDVNCQFQSSTFEQTLRSVSMAEIYWHHDYNLTTTSFWHRRKSL